MNLYWRRVDRLHVHTCTPGSVERPNGVGIPTQTPVFIRSVMSHKCRTCAESVLRSDAANRNVQRMIGKQFLCATGNRFKVEASAIFFYVFALAAKIGLQLAFLRESRAVR